MKTLQEYLAANYDKHAIDHILRARVDPAGNVTFYIHPHGKNGDTLDFTVVGNTLQPLY